MLAYTSRNLIPSYQPGELRQPYTSSSSHDGYISGLANQPQDSFSALDQLYDALAGQNWLNGIEQHDIDFVDPQQWFPNQTEDQPSQSDPQQRQNFSDDETAAAVCAPTPELTELIPQNVQRAGCPKSGISPELWEAHKDQIVKLYIGEDKTLKEVMDYLKLNRNFQASVKQYKTQLTQWKVHKYVPTDLLPWMKWKAVSRKQDKGKETRFKFHGQVYSNAALQRRLARRKTDTTLELPTGCQTPSVLQYETPTPTIQSPIADILSENIPVFDIRSPILDIGNDDHGGLSTDDTIAKCHILQQEASSLEEVGDLIDAETKYREAYEITREHSLITYKVSAIVAHQLAECCLRNKHFQQASDVLSTVLCDHVEEFGVKSEEVIEQAASIIDMCERWEFLHIAAKNTFTSVCEQKGCKCMTRTQPVQTADISEDEDEQQERLTAIVNLLSRLAQVCDANLSQFSEQALTCRVGMLQAMRHQRNSEDGDTSAFSQQVLTETSVIFRKILRRKSSSTSPMLNLLVRTAACFIPHQLETANDMFIRIETEAQEVFADEDDDQKLIELLLHIGVSFQNEKKWKPARSRFEHALALCYRDRKLHREMIARLEESSKKRHFRVEGLVLDL